MITECAVNFTRVRIRKVTLLKRRRDLGHANKSKLIQSDCTMLHVGMRLLCWNNFGNNRL